MLYDTLLFRQLRLTVGQNIHRFRVKQKMTLGKMAERSCVPAVKIDAYELGKGEIRLEEMLRISCALGVGVEALLVTGRG